MISAKSGHEGNGEDQDLHFWVLGQVERERGEGVGGGLEAGQQEDDRLAGDLAGGQGGELA